MFLALTIPLQAIFISLLTLNGALHLRPYKIIVHLKESGTRTIFAAQPCELCTCMWGRCTNSSDYHPERWLMHAHCIGVTTSQCNAARTATVFIIPRVLYLIFANKTWS